MSLAEGVEVLENTNKYVIFRYFPVSDGLTMSNIYIETALGCSGGKIIYQEIIREYSEWRYGFMNHDFSILTEAIYEIVFPFENGSAIVKTEMGFGVINQNGEIVILCEYINKPKFADNTITILIEETLSTTKQLVFNRKDGSYLYTLKRHLNAETGIYDYYKVDNKGKEVQIYELNGSNDAKYIPVRESSTTLWGYSNGFGEILVPAMFERAYPFEESMAKVFHDSKYGFIKENGKLIIDCQYDYAGNFSEGLAYVSTNGRYGYIDSTGALMIDVKYKWALDFKEGLAGVSQSGKYWGYINTDGEVVISEKYESVKDFSYGIASVKSSDSENFYYIDKAENLVFDNKYQFLTAEGINSDGYGLAKNIATTEIGDIDSRGYQSYEYYLIYMKGD